MEENNGEKSGPLTSLPVDRLTATNCNAAARAQLKYRHERSALQSDAVRRLTRNDWTHFYKRGGYGNSTSNGNSTKMNMTSKIKMTSK